MTHKLGTFKYEHGDDIPWSPLRWLSGLLVLALLIGAFAIAMPLGIVAVFVHHRLFPQCPQVGTAAGTGSDLALER